eukprot:1967302-Pleurochrysis_carterae.AAC.2
MIKTVPDAHLSLRVNTEHKSTDWSISGTYPKANCNQLPEPRKHAKIDHDFHKISLSADASKVVVADTDDG